MFYLAIIIRVVAKLFMRIHVELDSLKAPIQGVGLRPRDILIMCPPKSCDALACDMVSDQITARAG